MVMSSITVKGVTPDLAILGGYQRLVYNNPGSNSVAFQTDNMFAPTVPLSNYINWETRNNTLSGFRWTHTSTSLSTIGTLTLLSFVNASPTGTQILQVGEDSVITITSPMTFSGNLNMGGNKITNLATPTLATDAANKSYVDTASTITLNGAVTGTGSGTITTTLTPITTSQISNFNSSVVAFRLDQFANPTASVSMNSQKITNLGTPTLGTDAVTKTYVDTMSPTITLTGAVTGTGSGTISTTLTPITTSQISNFTSSVTAFRLDQFAEPTASVSLNSQKITNLLTPTAANDAANKSYVDAAVANAYATVLLTNNASLTDIVSVGKYVKVTGTTTSPLSSVFTVATTNRVTYPGTPSINAKVDTVLHFMPSGIPVLGSATVSFTIFLNDAATSYINPITVTVRNNADLYSVSLNTIIPMTTGQYIEVWVTSSNTAVDVTVQNMNFNVVQV